MFQKRLDPWFTLYMSYIFPGHVASYMWGETFWPAVWTAGALRYCCVLHFTWCVNSAAHLWGDHPYDTKSWPAENPFVSVVSCRSRAEIDHHQLQPPCTLSHSESNSYREHHFSHFKLFVLFMNLSGGDRRGLAQLAPQVPF